jgi:mannose-6-phosphate isomerase-like protein (cupin superfamily)
VARIRRVVTGHDREGKSILASDVQVDAILPTLVPGSEYFNLWGADEAPQLPDRGERPTYTDFVAPLGGFRFSVFTYPPGGETNVDALNHGGDDEQSATSDLLAYMESESPGMHTVDNVDCAVILDGEIWLELDDGVEIHLEAGDTYVQNGTRHAWHNHGTKPCRFAVFSVGAHDTRRS